MGNEITDEIIEYHCNICGAPNRLVVADLHRESAFCSQCGANARFRRIILTLAEMLGQDPLVPLCRWPRRGGITGVGMSDWPGYAELLAQKFNYQNSYYDQPPHLDIQNLTSRQRGKYDFVISSDVFEHVLPPLESAFANLLALLKPGGALIFSVPYSREESTREHFPDLDRFEIFDFHGEKILVNRNREGALRLYDNLIFHGGGGATLELRLFCEADLLRRLAAAGFSEITVRHQPHLPTGAFWPEIPSPDPGYPTLYAYIISARKPRKKGVMDLFR